MQLEQCLKTGGSGRWLGTQKTSRSACCSNPFTQPLIPPTCIRHCEHRSSPLFHPPPPDSDRFPHLPSAHSKNPIYAQHTIAIAVRSAHSRTPPAPLRHLAVPDSIAAHQSTWPAPGRLGIQQKPRLCFLSYRLPYSPNTSSSFRLSLRSVVAVNLSARPFSASTHRTSFAHPQIRWGESRVRSTPVIHRRINIGKCVSFLTLS
jgi:hypothetical protein